MIIKRMEVFNFGPFYDKQEIRFGGSDETEFDKITVIYAQNRSGSAAVYQALIYCLHGENILAENDSCLVNLFALNEDALGDQRGIQAYVSVSFTHRDKDYEMYRALSGIRRDDGKVVEQSEALRLTILNRNRQGQSRSLIDTDQIEREISGILAPRVKAYFFCDRGSIDRLTGITRKKHVQTGIEKLLKIDELLLAKEAIGILCQMLAEELKGIAADDYEQHSKQRRDSQAIIDDLAEMRKSIEQELGDARLQLTRLDQELNKYQASTQLFREYRAKEIKQQQLIRQKTKALTDLRQFMPTAVLLLARDLLAELYQDIDEQREKGYVPPAVKKELVEKILMEMTCICGQPVTLHSAEYRHLQQWLAKTDEALSRETMEIFGRLSLTIGFLNSQLAEFFRLLQYAGSVDEDYYTVTTGLETLKEALAGSPDADSLRRLYDQYDQTRGKIGDCEHQYKLVSEALSRAETELQELDGEIERLAKQHDAYLALQEKHKVVAKTQAVMGKLITDFIQEMKQAVGQQTNSNFEHLLDADGCKLLQKVIVNDDDTLEVLDWEDKPVFDVISPSWRQVAALSFLIALAQVAAGAQRFEIPLFLEFPFGRLTDELDENVLTYVPRITSQLILLAGRDFGADEGRKLFNTGRWGGFYLLETVQEDVTTIKQLPAELYNQVLACQVEGE